MLRNKDFYVGLVVGVILFYVYQNHMKKGPTSLWQAHSEPSLRASSFWP